MACFDQAKWAVSHDPFRAGDRTPKGAVAAGTVVHLVLRVEPSARPAVCGASVLVGDRTSGYSGLNWNELSLDEGADGYAGFVSLDAAPHVLFYAFKLLLADGDEAFYVPRADGRATAGELVRQGQDGYWTPRGWMYAEHRLRERYAGGFGLAEVPPGFQITVFEPAFATPSWMPGAIMYQIFPDRFARGPLGPREEGLRYHEALKRPVRLHGDWSEPVEWLAPPAASESLPDAAQPADEAEIDARAAAYDPIDFFGGTLEGIRGQLPYLASLGVEVIYLNPVFEARSNHRYDTADYEHIDPLLGSDDDFSRLAEDAGRLGIRIVLDAVLSHTGDDSRYFNARGTYPNPGAAQGGQSPYFRWYDFECISGRVPYRCWWGDPTLPEVDEHNPDWQNYVLGDDGILARWLAVGASGYRLDVADELPDDVLERLRTLVKAKNPDAAIIGEVWEDATTKESYGVPRTYALGSALDSVMNYPLRSALLGFALGTVDAHQLVAFLRQQQLNYPPQLHACLMNLLSSHDVERVRSVLALGGPIRHEPRKRQAKLVAGITSDQDARAATLQRMVVALLYALPGMPCLYYGDECGLQGGGDPFCRATFPVQGNAARADCGCDLTAFYRELGALRTGSAALRTGSFSCTAPHRDVMCLVRVAPGGRDEAEAAGAGVVVVATNRSDVARTVAFDAASPGFGLPSGDSWAVRAHGAQGTLLHSSAEAAGGAAGATPAAESLPTCEDGIVRLTVPPAATTYWRLG